MRHVNARRNTKPSYKQRVYAKGVVETFGIAGFGAPDDFGDIYPGCAAASDAILAMTLRQDAMRP